MPKRFLAILLLLALALSGCIEPNNGPIPPTPGTGEIDLVKSYPLEGAWARSEAETGSYDLFYSNSSGNTDTIVFENDEITCKTSVMPGVEPRAEFAFAFFAKGAAPREFIRGLQPFRVFEFQDRTLQVFTRCGDAYEQTPAFIEGVFEGLSKTGTEQEYLEWYQGTRSFSIEDKIEFLRNFPLEDGWTRKEGAINPFYEIDDEALNPANIIFENDEIICKKSMMTGYPKTGAIYSFSFYRQGSEPKGAHQIMPYYYIYLDSYVAYFFSDCSDQLPEFIQEMIDGLGGRIEIEPGLDEVNAVASIEKPSGWVVSGISTGSQSDWDDERLAYFVVFSAPDKLCKGMVMSGFDETESNPSIAVAFYRKEFSEELEEEIGSSLRVGETANTRTENYFVVFTHSYTSCYQDEDEKELLKEICLAIVPFTESKDPNWSGYCG